MCIFNKLRHWKQVSNAKLGNDNLVLVLATLSATGYKNAKQNMKGNRKQSKTQINEQ